MAEFKEFVKVKTFIGTSNRIVTIENNTFTEKDTNSKLIYSVGVNNISVSMDAKTLTIIDKNRIKHHYTFPNLESLKRWNEKLQQSTEIPNLSFLNEPAISINSSGFIVECNGPFEKLFGYEKKEILNKNIIIIIDPSHMDITQHDGHIQKFLTTRRENLIGNTSHIRYYFIY